MSVTDFTVEYINRKALTSFIEKHHYSHNINGIQSYHHFGLYTEGNFGLPKMIGAMLYAMPSMPHTAKKYNPINPDRCMELRRLVCIDDTPKNAESFFIGKTIRWLKQHTDYEVIVSFADKEHGHTGVIYKASNFEFIGETGAGRVLMVDGKEYHSRSLSQPIKPYSRRIRARWEAKDPDVFFRKRKSKNRYVYYLNKGIKKKIERLKKA